MWTRFTTECNVANRWHSTAQALIIIITGNYIYPPVTRILEFFRKWYLEFFKVLYKYFELTQALNIFNKPRRLASIRLPFGILWHAFWMIYVCPLRIKNRFAISNMYLGLKIFTNLSIIKLYRLKKALKRLKQLKMQTKAQPAQIIN